MNAPQLTADQQALSRHIQSLDDDALRDAARTCNAFYRAGEDAAVNGIPVDDWAYDHVILAELRRRHPDDTLLQQVEAEPEDLYGPPVRHKRPMLSTQKLYTQAEVNAWVARIRKAADKLGLKAGTLVVRVTPKLDGLAGFDDGEVLATRGDSLTGQDITVAFRKGVIPVGGRGQGAGEIVIEEGYFEQHIRVQYNKKHPRQFMVGLVSADDVKPHHRQAIDAGVCRFVPYVSLKAANTTLDEFSKDWAGIMQQAVEGLPYLTDGAVAELVDPAMKEAMGATSEHHRWMAALKSKGQTALTVVNSITLQTGRTGRITPVAEINPVFLSGATLSRATMHSARKLIDSSVGPGSEIRIVRSGEVIPYIDAVIHATGWDKNPNLGKCPACGGETEWEPIAEGKTVSEHLTCINIAGCPAQAARRLKHFFQTLGNADGFGDVTVDKLISAGVTTIPQVYQMDQAAFVSAGISPGDAANLVDELKRSRTESVQDWKLLGALGVRHLGRGDSRHILEIHPIEKVLDLKAEDLLKMLGFGELTSGAIVEGLTKHADTLRFLLGLGFNLERTPYNPRRLKGSKAEAPAPVAGNAIAGLNIVFTGTFDQPRGDLEEQARKLGANVQSGVNKKTQVLVAGANVGAGKTNKAKELGTRVVSEVEYLAMLPH